jgi:DNA/RNA endonuclease G (NUC1)
VIESSRPSFKSTGTPAHVNPATSYTQASQLTRLTELLGSQEQAQRFIFTNSYMARGHMSPDADGIYRSWQFTTYFYTNVVPQWQVINAGNWLRIENAARSIATTMGEDLVIFNGAHGILTLPHVNGQQIPITLEAGGNIEVPFWYYKVIKSPATNSAIAMVTLNNPFVTTIAANDIPCTDICSQTGWFHANYNNFALGRTICCTVADLRARVPSVPAEALAGNVLTWR